MVIYRTSPIPAFLTRLPLIHRWRCSIAPVEEDLAILKDYAGGRRDVDEPLSSHAFRVAIDLPDLDDIEARMRAGKFKSSATLGYSAFGWDAVDVARILRYDRDDDEIARKLRDEDFDRDFVELTCCRELDGAQIRSLGVPTSILPFIDDWQRFDSLCQVSDPVLRKSSTRVDHTWHLRQRERESIERDERVLFELHRGERRHRKLRATRRSAVATAGLMTPGLREQILRYDKYTCFFTGAAPPNIEVDVHHILSRRIIEILELPRELLTAPYNLVTVEGQLNRVKGPHLFKADVERYFERFADRGHRNHPILLYLTRIKDLQSGLIQ